MSLRVFVPHASDLLTDRQSNGDGLVAFEIVSRLASRGHEVHAAAPEIDVGGRIPSGLHLYELPVRSRVGARLDYSLRSRLLFERIRRRTAIDVIHQLNPVATGVSLALMGSRLPVVLGSFIADWPDGRNPLAPAQRDSPVFRRFKRSVAWLHQRQASVLLVTTEAARERIVDESAQRSKVVVVPHGVDVDQYSPAAASAEPQSILFLGGIEYRKGVFTLLDAFTTVAASATVVRLTIAGSGHLYPHLLQVVAQHRYRERIDVLGSVPRNEVPALLQRCTVFCLPSTAEPFGMSLLEAMAAGKPVVVTDAGGPRYLVDEAGGRKVPPHNAPALAAALLDVLADPTLQRSMGVFNRSLVETTYRWERVIDRLEAVYRSLVPRSA